MNIKRIVTAFWSFVILISVCSCSFDNNEKEESSATANSFTAEEILTKLLEKSDEKNLDSKAFFDDELFVENCGNLYGIEYSQLKDGGIAYAGSGGYADEISIIKAKDMSDSVVLSLLEKRVERRVQDFTGYRPTEIAKIENSSCFVSDGFAVLIISDNVEKLEKRIKFIIEQR